MLGTNPGAVLHALLVRQWSDDVVYFAHSYEPTELEERQLRARGIEIVRGEVARLVVDRDELKGIELVDGSVDPPGGGVRPPDQHTSPRRAAGLARL